MIVIEMRDAAYNKLFGLVDEVKELDKKKRIVMCELEEAVYDCYEASKNDEDYKNEDEDLYEDHFEKDDEEFEMNFRNKRIPQSSARMRGMRMRSRDLYGEDMRGVHTREDLRRRSR